MIVFRAEHLNHLGNVEVDEFENESSRSRFGLQKRRIEVSHGLLIKIVFFTETALTLHNGIVIEIFKILHLRRAETDLGGGQITK